MLTCCSDLSLTVLARVGMKAGWAPGPVQTWTLLSLQSGYTYRWQAVSMGAGESLRPETTQDWNVLKHLHSQQLLLVAEQMGLPQGHLVPQL